MLTVMVRATAKAITTLRMFLIMISPVLMGVTDHAAALEAADKVEEAKNNFHF
jgi:hypothetical protein